MNLQKKRCLFVVMIFLFLGFIVKDEETKATVVPTNFLVETPQLATAIPEATNNEETITFSALYTGKTLVGFKEAPAYCESRGSHAAVNRFGYTGKCQFGKRILRFFGVNDIDEFLNSLEQQERVFTLSPQCSRWFLHKEIEKYVGKKIDGVEITESGILAAAHLAGATSVHKYLKRQGNYDFAGGNGITLQHYLKLFVSYGTSHIVPEEKPKIQFFPTRYNYFVKKRIAIQFFLDEAFFV